MEPIQQIGPIPGIMSPVSYIMSYISRKIYMIYMYFIIFQEIQYLPFCEHMSHFNPWSAKLNNINFHPLEVVSRWVRDP